LELKNPEHLTKDLAYLLGTWDGDGKKHSRGLAWTGNRLEHAVRDQIRNAFERTFNHSIPLQESPSRPGSFDLVKWSQPLKRWFEEIAGPRGLAVPKVLLQAPRDRVSNYLRGLFDTDGCVNKAGIIGIGMKGACESFLREIQMLLTALGIDSYLSFHKTFLKKTGKTYPGVALRIRSRIGRERFLKEIGFTEPSKNALLTKFVETSKRSLTRGDIQMYPVPLTFITAYQQIRPHATEVPQGFYSTPLKAKRSGLVSRGSLEKLTQLASQREIDTPEIRFLRSLLDLHVLRVKSVINTGRDEPVVDLGVEGDHEYQTGPILSHNSADIVTTTWVDPDLMKMNRVQWQCMKSRDNKPFERFESRVEWACRRILTCMDVSMKPTPAPAGTGQGSKEAIAKAGKLLD
jgi:intein/homing endonuclease